MSASAILLLIAMTLLAWACLWGALHEPRGASERWVWHLALSWWLWCRCVPRIQGEAAHRYMAERIDRGMSPRAARADAIAHLSGTGPVSAWRCYLRTTRQ